MTERIYLQLFHSDVPGAVPSGLKIGELGLNVADGIEFYGYGGDINYDVNGNPLPDLPPIGMGWKATGIGGDGPPGPPGPEGPGVPEGGTTGQYLRKATDGDYVTTWDDGPSAATADERGLVYGFTNSFTFGQNANIGYGVAVDDSNEQMAALGYQAGSQATGTQDNVLVGYRAGYALSGGRNVILGSGAAGGTGGASTGNVILGYQSGYNVTTANFNTLVGPTAGYNIRTGDNNTIIGGYDGSFDLQGNVVLSDGAGTVRFQANDSGAWSPDGLDYGQPGYLLTSNGPDEAPEWKEAPLALVSQIVAGENISIYPPDGLGVVTINATGGGGGTSNINSLISGDGVTLTNASGVPVPILTGPGTISINSTEVLTPGLYNEAGSILIGGFGSGGVASLAPGTSGQVLTINPSTGFPYWGNPTGTNAATPTVAGVVYGRTDGALSKNVTLGLNAGSALLGGGTANVFIGTAAGSNVNTGDNNVIIGAYSGVSDLQGNIVLADGAGNVRFQTNSAGALSFDGTNYGTAGYVLSSTGPGGRPVWVANTNAPIQTITGGTGITATPSGTNVTIANTGVVQLVNGTGTTAVNNGNGTWQINTNATAGVSKIIAGANVSISPTSGIGEVTISAAGGGGGGNITSITGGAGIGVQSGTGPVVTLTNTGVTKLTAGSNITITPAGNTTGDLVISATGGGTGTVTSIGTGPGLTGGPITGSGTIGVDGSVVLTKNSFGNNGSFVYWNGSFQTLNPPTTDIGSGVYSLGVTSSGLPVWGADYTTKAFDGDGTTVQMGGFTTEKGAFRVNLNYTELSSRYVAKTSYSTTGGILYASAANTPTQLAPGAQGQILTVGAGGIPTWATNTATVDVTAPITKSGSTIGFNVDTTALTAYVLKSAFNSTGTILVGSGVGSFSALGPGATGQVLTVTPSGLGWVTPSSGSSFSLTSPDESLTITPSPFTSGTGTIVVNANKFVSTSILSTPGDLIVGAGSPTQAARLPAGGTVGMVLTVTDTTGNSRIGWTNTINGGSF